MTLWRLPSPGLSLHIRKTEFAPKAFAALTFHGSKYSDNVFPPESPFPSQGIDDIGHYVFRWPFPKHDFVSWANYK